MKTTTQIISPCLVLASLFASASPIELVVHGASDSAAPIVVEEIPSDNLERPLKWTFTAPATGWTPRTVLRIPTTVYQLPATNSFAAYLDTDGSGSYTPGEPFGVSNLRGTPEIELTDMSAITPRVNLWNNDVGTASDRGVVTGPGEVTDGTVFDPVTPAAKTLVTVSRYRFNRKTPWECGVTGNAVVYVGEFASDARTFLHEGDLLASAPDIDWGHLYADAVENEGTYRLIGALTNASYLVTYNWDPTDYHSSTDTNVKVRACSTLVTRRFEKTRTVPTPVSAYLSTNQPSQLLNFSFRIDNEDKWASWFGTTYTAFKMKVLNGSTEVWDSGILRLPPRDKNGVYTFQTFQPFNLSTLQPLTWRVAVYNSKFMTDTIMSSDVDGVHDGDPFSPAQPITDDPPPQQDDPSGFVEIQIFLGRYRRLAGDVHILNSETFKPLHVVPFSSTRPDRIVARFHTADTNAAFAAYLDLDASGSYTPGEPFGVSNLRDTPAIELTDMSAITPRVNLWSGDVDRTTRTGTDWLHDLRNCIWTDSSTGRKFNLYDRFEKTTATVPKNRVRIVRYSVDKFPVYKVGVDAGVVLEKDFEREARDLLHEGDFLADGDLDLDWKNLYTDVVDWQGAQLAACEVTNVTYLIVYNWDKSEYASDNDTNTQVKANATLVTRRFEVTRSVPTPVLASSLASGTTFSFRIDNEDKWASWFGTTYTSFKVKVLNGSTEVWDSGILRLPPRDKNGVYTFQTYKTFQTSQTLTWRVAVYNAKFKTDTLMKMETEGDPFSSAQPITVIGD